MDEINYQSGEHSIDRTPSLSQNDDGFIEFDFEARAIFKRLADDIYKSTEAGIREPLSNSLTAIKRAERNYGLENGTVEITLKKGDGLKLIIQDNGIGISEQVLQKVLTVIGRSMNRDDGSVSGKYGMGFLACYKLVGTDGGFEMYTRSRRTDETIAGVWKPGGFDKDLNGELSHPFDDDQYGTRFEFYVQESISASNIREWVEKYSNWARFPVFYEEVEADGTVVFDEDYGGHTLTDQYEEEKALIIENEYFEAVCAPSTRNRTLLLDSPIDRNFRGLTDNPWSIDIRLKNENGVVVSGPHEGLMPVNENEYREMRDDRKSRYIPTERLSSDDLQLPEPTGTRDTLGEHDEFWYWLGEQFDEKHRTELKRLFTTVTSKQDFIALSEADAELLMGAFNKLDISEDNWEQLQTDIQNELSLSIPQNTARMYIALTNTVQILERGGNVSHKNGYNTAYSTTPVWNIVRKAEPEGDVYMGVSLNQLKSEAIWADNTDNVIVSVEDSTTYPFYRKRLGWEKQKQITSRTIDDYDVPTEMKEQFKQTTSNSSNNNSGKNTPNRHLKIHTSSSGKANNTLKVQTVKNRFEAGPEDSERQSQYDKLILFPSNSDFKLSNHYHLTNSNIGIANCSVSVYNYLQDVPGIIRIEDYYKNAKTVTFTTSHGKTTIQKAKQKGYVVIHPLSETTKEIFQEKQVMEAMQEYIVQKVNNFNWTDNPSEIVYIPATTTELQSVRPILSKRNTFDSEDTTSIKILSGDTSYDIGNSIQIPNTLDAYAYCCLPNWYDSTEVTVLTSLNISFEPSGVQLVNFLKNQHDKGKQPISVDFEGLYDVSQLVLKTSNGNHTFGEIQGNANITPVFHILPLDSIEKFRQPEIMDGGEDFVTDYVMENQDMETPLKKTNAKTVVYVPITYSEYKELKPHIDKTTVYLKGEVTQRVRGKSLHNIYSDTQVYAYSRLQSIKNTEMFTELINCRKDFTDGGYELIETVAQSANTDEDL